MGPLWFIYVLICHGPTITGIPLASVRRRVDNSYPFCMFTFAHYPHLLSHCLWNVCLLSFCNCFSCRANRLVPYEIIRNAPSGLVARATFHWDTREEHNLLSLIPRHEQQKTSNWSDQRKWGRQSMFDCEPCFLSASLFSRIVSLIEVVRQCLQNIRWRRCGVIRVFLTLQTKGSDVSHLSNVLRPQKLWSIGLEIQSDALFWGQKVELGAFNNKGGFDKNGNLLWVVEWTLEENAFLIVYWEII